MPKDILVHIPVTDRAKPVIDCAVSLAQTFGAHLDGVVRIYQSFNPAIAIEFSAAALAVEAEIEPDVQMAEATLEQFMAAAAEAGIPYGTKTISGKASAVFRRTAELSRLYSLVVVAQLDPQKPNHDSALPEMVLLECGRPLLLIPYIHRGPLKMHRVLICWDGGSQAARAVHAYLEMLSLLAPRYYSISSSPSGDPARCSVTVGVVEAPASSGRGVYKGVCSNYLSGRRVGDNVHGPCARRSARLAGEGHHRISRQARHRGCQDRAGQFLESLFQDRLIAIRLTTALLKARFGGPSFCPVLA